MPFFCDGKELQIEEVSWSDISNNIRAINKPLYEEISGLQLNKKHKLYKARYRYGDQILSKGGLGLPVKRRRNHFNKKSQYARDLKKSN